MLSLHEPSGSIRPDRQNSHLWRTTPAANFCKDRTVPVRRVPCTVDRALRRFEEETSPKRHPMIAETARGPMVRRHYCCTDLLAEVKTIPPIAHGNSDISHAGLRDRVVAQRCKEARLMNVPKLFQRPQVHVIVVVVRHQDCMDRGQITQRDCRRIVPARSDETKRASPFRPDRVHQ